MSKSPRPPVKVRRACKHPGRFFNRCRNCPLRKARAFPERPRSQAGSAAAPVVGVLGAFLGTIAVAGALTLGLAGGALFGHSPTAGAVIPKAPPTAQRATLDGAELVLPVVHTPWGGAVVIGVVVHEDGFGPLPTVTYRGYNVAGGAPVYAYVDGAWEQGVNPASWTDGTEVVTPDPSAIVPGVVTERLGWSS